MTQLPKQLVLDPCDPGDESNRFPTPDDRLAEQLIHVVDPATGHRRQYEPGAYYGAYFASPTTMFPVARMDDAWPLKEQLFAVRIGNQAKAYPLREIARAGGSGP